MNLVNNSSRITRIRLVILLAISISLAFLSGAVYAGISNEMPNDPDFTAGDDVYLEVARQGRGNSLDAPESRIRVYFPPASGGSGTLELIDPDSCQSGNGVNGWDANHYNQTTFEFIKVQSDDTTAPATETAAPQYNNIDFGNFASNCTDIVRTINLTGMYQISANTAYEDWYVIELVATMAGTSATSTNALAGGGVNRFKVNALGGGLVGYSINADSKFALQDARNPDANNLDNFILTFAPDCTVSGSQPGVRLEWKDDDFGTPTNDAPGFRFELREYDRADLSTPTNTWFLNNNQTHNFASSTGWTGHQNSNDGTVGLVTFTIQEDHVYEWEWFDVKRRNGIQFQVPYDSINYDFDCPNPDTPPTITATAQCDPNTGTGTITGRAGDLDGSARVQARVEHNGTNQILTTGYTLNQNPDEAFTLNIPASFMSSGNNTRVEWVRVQNVGPDGVYNVYAAGFGGTNDNILNLGICGEYWEYDPEMPTGPADTATTPKPGDVLNISGITRNIGTGRGEAFRMVLRWRYDTPTGLSSWNRTSEAAKTGIIVPGNTRSITRNITVPNDAVHGGQICIQTGNNNWRGESTPLPPDITNPGWRYSTGAEELCYTIFNQRFDIEDNVLATLTPSGPLPNDILTFTYTAVNNDDTERLAAYPGSVGGSAYRVGYTLNITGTGASNPMLDTHTAAASTIPYNSTGRTGFATVQVGPNAQPGDEICVQVVISPEYGFSIDSGNVAITQAGGSVTSPPDVCQKVGEKPYIEVINADIWAGGDWDPSIIGTSWCSVNPTKSFIKSSREGSVGSFVEFAATALDSIEEFATTNGYTNFLAFANVGVDGFFNTEGKCVIDYYEYLSTDTTDTGVTGYGGSINATGQFVSSTDVTLSGATVSNNQHILLVDGSVDINGDILYNNYNVSDPDDVPFFMVVATGDINIDSSVTELNGIYVSKGDINTCDDPSLALSINICPLQLTIKGMFIANDVQFRRTHSGVVRNSAGNPLQGAELFLFSPETYIASPPYVSDFERNYQTSQIKDLPPVY